MLKKLSAWLLALAFCLAILPSLAEDEPAGLLCDGFRYRLLEDGTAEILSYEGRELALHIPGTLDGYIVTSIADEAFYNYPYSLQELIIPDTVTYIGSMAFALSELESLEIPAGVVRMGDRNPFGYCDYLETLTVAEGNPVFYTEDGVLFCREDRSLVSFPNMLADGAYTVPEGIERIRGSAFGGVMQLETISLPSGLREIGYQAFAFCWDLESIVIPDSVTVIEDNAFDFCNSLASAVLPAGLTRIGSMMFYECNDLKTVNIPDTVTEIGPSAFNFCYSLEEIHIPAGVTEIPDSAFECCQQVASLVIPEGVTVIGDLSFSGCSTLSDITIPDTVIRIGSQAFQSCVSLQAVTIPDSVTEIGADAFFNCAEDLVITCGEGSPAAAYCEENGIPFILK